MGTSIITADRTGQPTGNLRTGLILAIVLGLANLPFLALPAPDGESGPPLAALVLSAAIGILSIITAWIAWRTGSRAAVRVTAACVIINALSALPALFVDVDAWVKLVSSLYVLASVVCLVLLFKRRHAR
jgi:hypothetical protein